MTNSKPIIFLAFADSADANLPRLAEELRLIRTALAPAIKFGWCEVIERANATLDDILDVFRQYRDRITLFHYGGHATSYQLLLTQNDGALNKINAGGLAEFLSQQRNLQVVFLNGCSSGGQVDALLDAGIGAVIATAQEILDSAAVEIADHFYRSLGAGQQLQTAYNEAVAAMRAKYGEDVATDSPWQLRIRPEFNQLRNWLLSTSPFSRSAETLGSLAEPIMSKPLPSIEGKRVTLPSRRDLLAYTHAICAKDEFARWADASAADSTPLFDPTNPNLAPDTYLPTRAIRPLPTRLANLRSQQEGQAQTHEVIETLLDEVRTVVCGEPGSGKSSALQRLTWLLAQRTLAAAVESDASEAPITLPIFASLADYDGEESLLPLLRRAINLIGVLAIDEDHDLKALLRAQNVSPVLLLDGLNEIRSDLSEQGLRAIRRHLADYPAHAVHVTCRTADYDVATQTFTNASRWEIQALSDAIRYWGDTEGESEVRTYLRRHLGEERGKRLYANLRNDDRLRTLAQLPLFLWMLKETAGSRAGELPNNRGELLRSFVQSAIQEKVAVSIQHLAEESLYQLAWQWQTQGKLKGADDELEIILQRLPNLRRFTTETIRLELRKSGLLIDLGRGELKLLHQLVQEYAAAAHLTKLNDCAAQLPRLAEQEAWRESVIAALWLRNDLHSADYLLALMSTPAIDLRVRVEAARILAHIGDPRLQPKPLPPQEPLPNPPSSGEGADWWTDKVVSVVRGGLGRGLFIAPVMIPIPAGVALLGANDDDAYDDEEPCTVAIAAFELAQHPVTNAEFRCFIEAGGYEDESLWTPGGQAWLRGEGKLDTESEKSYREQHQYFSKDIDGWIALLRQGGAISEESIDAWKRTATWSEDEYIVRYGNALAGEKRQQPFYWTNTQFNLLNQPVVGVNWYEAMAYASWLSRVTGKEYTLPSEAQWEWAAGRRASGDQRLEIDDQQIQNPKSKIQNSIYPWGSAWDANKCNWSGSRLNAPAPIGVFAQGATSDGLQDMAGNVYEWTTSLYRAYPYVATDGREDTETDGIRVMRGGSWYTDCRWVRCSDRSGLNSWRWHGSVGYRLARILS